MEQIAQLGGFLRSFLTWMRERPLSAFLFFAVSATVIYFFGVLPLYAGQTQPIWEWAWLRFLPQYNQEHSKLIPFMCGLGLMVWMWSRPPLCQILPHMNNLLNHHT